MGPQFEQIESELAALTEFRDKPAGNIRITAPRPRGPDRPMAHPASAAARLPRHHGRDRVLGREDEHRRRALRRGRAHRRVHREGHGRGMHRPAHAYGGGRVAGLPRRTRQTPEARGPDGASVHQPGPRLTRRLLPVGVRTGRKGGQRPGRRTACVLKLVADPPGGPRRARPGVPPGAGVLADVAEGRLVRVLEPWCEPFPSYHLYYPSRRQPTAAFTLLVEALRHRD